MAEIAPKVQVLAHSVIYSIQTTREKKKNQRSLQSHKNNSQNRAIAGKIVRKRQAKMAKWLRKWKTISTFEALTDA